MTPGLDRSRRFCGTLVRPIIADTLPKLSLRRGATGDGLEVLDFGAEVPARSPIAAYCESPQ